MRNLLQVPYALILAPGATAVRRTGNTKRRYPLHDQLMREEARKNSCYYADFMKTSLSLGGFHTKRKRERCQRLLELVRVENNAFSRKTFFIESHIFSRRKCLFWKTMRFLNSYTLSRKQCPILTTRPLREKNTRGNTTLVNKGSNLSNYSKPVAAGNRVA